MKYPLAVVARATDKNQVTVRSWLDRQYLLTTDADDRGSAKGKANQISLRTALRLGVMSALVDLGVPPKRAGTAASMWMDRNQPGRRAGGFFEKKYTALVVHTDGTDEVINITPNGGQGTAASMLARGGATVLPLEDVVNKMIAKLGLAEIHSLPRGDNS